MNEPPNAIDRSQMLSLGSTLQGGKYRIERYLSSGGFGNTYVVVNTVFEERYAMKEFFMKGISERESDSTTVSVSNSSNKEQFSSQKDKFKKEAQRLRRLRDAHLVFVHDFFEENGTAYYVMDYVDGESVSTLLKRRGVPFGEDEALGIFRQVLDALHVVHEKKIWHLDLKPGNIILDKSGRAVVIDFGASKQLSGVGGYMTTTTSMCYTPGYAPSEQIDQKMERIGPWTDLYALGGTLYNMLTLHTPPTVSEVIEGDAFDYPQSVNKRYRELVSWLMTPDRKCRPQSVADVVDFLDKSSYASYEKEIPENHDDDTVLGVKATDHVEDTPKPAADTGKEEDKERQVNSEDEQPESPVLEKEPDVSFEANDVDQTPWYKKYLYIFIGIITVIFVGSLFYFLISNRNDSQSDVSVKSAQEKVESLRYDFEGIGSGSYTGMVDSENRPNDEHGVVSFDSGNRYEGPCAHGVMEGDGAKFTFANGDTFEGSFKGNFFASGRYNSKSDGTYFIGKFKDGQPTSDGTWYDKNGNVIQ